MTVVLVVLLFLRSLRLLNAAAAIARHVVINCGTLVLHPLLFGHLSCLFNFPVDLSIIAVLICLAIEALLLQFSTFVADLKHFI